MVVVVGWGGGGGVVGWGGGCDDIIPRSRASDDARSASS